MSAARLAAIARYPIKGFGPQKLSFAELRRGAGIEHDRRFAVANGQSRVLLDEEMHGAVRTAPRWQPCGNFVRLTQNRDLPLYPFEFDEDALHLSIRSPKGERISADLTDPESVARCNAALTAWFPPGQHGSPGLVEGRASGFWDHEDAPISIINVETVRAIARASGMDLDPIRFRGNLYIDALPAWGELGLLGRRIRIGDAELEILRPIDRCKATSVNPSTSDVDVHIPLVLARTFGHVFCGVYARVVRPGRVKRDDPCIDIGPASEILDHPLVDTAPPPHQWPRAVRVEAREDESSGVVSFWLRDPLPHLRGRADGSRSLPRPGQHVRIHTEAPLPAWRCYTVSDSTPDGLVRISVKREESGIFSSHLHRSVQKGDSLVLSGPFGDFTLPEPAASAEARRPIVFLSAGIGITPVVAMLRGLAPGQAPSVHVVHGARCQDELALWDEVEAAVSKLENATAALYFSRPAQGDLARRGAHHGRIDFERLAESLPLSKADIYLCGPDAFLRDAKAAFAKYGIAPERIHYEAFISPRKTSTETSAETPKAPSPGPFRVRFLRSKVEATWREGAGSLLELGEASGLALDSSCRSGTCQTCRHRITEGTVTHLLDLLDPPEEGTALLCCSVPTADITIDG